MYPGYEKDLDAVVRSEVYGQSAFGAAARTARGERRQTWLTLERLESHTRSLIETQLVEWGRPAGPCRAQAVRGMVGGTALPLLPWFAEMRLVLKATHHYLPIFERLRTAHANGPSAEVFEFIVEHERALASFATGELQGRDSTMSAVTDLLDPLSDEATDA